MWISAAAGLLCLLIYNANLRLIGAGDTYPARYLPFGMWRYHTVLLDPIQNLIEEHAFNPYWVVHGRQGHAVSLYPVVVPIAVAPLYLPAVFFLHERGWDEQRTERIAKIMEKASASLVAAASVALLYLLLRRRAGPRSALLLTLVYGLGTTTWVISSQSLWPHGLAELLVIATLFLLTGPCTIRTALAVGFLSALIACNRPPDAILAAAFVIYGLWWARRLSPLLLAAAALPMGLLLAYNVGVVGNLLGGYGVVGKAAFFQHDLISGVLALLFSPTRGLFIFSPFLLFLLCCFPRVLRDPTVRGLTAALGIATILLLLLYAKADWRQGVCWGPRWLTDTLPILFWMLPPVVVALGRAGRIAFVSACIAAVAIQAVGAFWYEHTSDAVLFAAADGPAQMQAGWTPRNAPFLAELRHARAPVSPLVRFYESAALRLVDDWRSGAAAVSRSGPEQVAKDKPALTSSRPGDLTLSAQMAAAAIANRQEVAGYWLTSYTDQARFVHPHLELNTFLNALMIDILSPVAAQTDLRASLQQAAQYLTNQIEAGGLVRYHGRPDAPTIGTLGCVITPDSDDTALVWRIAPAAHSELLPAALATMAQYRTPDGLYRTWLSPPDRFQCIDPGKDPDPADVVIQMHIYMLLAKANPPAAHALCSAIGGAIAEDRIWVYYRAAPLVPILRQIDLEQDGCSLELPPSRLQTSEPGQADWIALGQLLRRFTADGQTPAPAEVAALLEKLSRNDFSRLRESPPLVYHNDFTASVPRFYWSEELGYALWLRLYFENLHRPSARSCGVRNEQLTCG